MKGIGCVVSRVFVLTVVLGLGFAGLATAAPAADCNGALNIRYVSGAPFGVDGDVYRVEIGLGTGSITGGTNNELSISQLQFFLDCTFQGLPGCTDDGNVVNFAGNITTSCATTWTPVVGANTVNFSAAPPVVIPANQPPFPGFCVLQFDIVLANSFDARNDLPFTPDRVEEIIRFSNASCDSGLPIAGSQSSAFDLCRICDDGNGCTTDACNNQNNQCVYTPSVVCNDQNACTADVCDPATGTCVYTPNVVCNDNNGCTLDVCDPATGTCVYTPNVVCNDNNGCTLDVCDPATGICVYTPNVVCNDNNGCTLDVCDPATGTCVYTPDVVCNDNNGCTLDVCDPATGTCVYTPNVTCDDGDDCTDDFCDPATGACVYTPNDACLICLVIIDEEGVDNDMRSVERAALACSVKPEKLVNDEGVVLPLPTNSVCRSQNLDSSDNLPVECGNPPLRWNKRVASGQCGGNANGPGRLALMPTGQVDDEGWFALPPPGANGGLRYSDQRPSSCNIYTSGAVDPDGKNGYQRWVSDFVAGIVRQECLDKIRDVVPLRNQDLVQLVGKTCVAVVYDSDISSNTQPLDANLQGRRYGTFTFKVEAIEVPGSLPESGSSTTLYDMWLRILPPEVPGFPMQAKIHDHEPDSIQVTRATFNPSSLVLTVEGTSNYPGDDNTPPYLQDPSSAVNDPNSVYNTPLLPTPDSPGDNLAYMTVSVDNPSDGDNAADPTIDPFIREVQMVYVGGNLYRVEISVPPAAGDLRGRRLVIQTDEGGAYNVRIQ